MVDGREKVNNFQISLCIFYKQQASVACSRRAGPVPQSLRQVFYKLVCDQPLTSLTLTSHGSIWACSGRGVHRVLVIDTMTFRTVQIQYTEYRLIFLSSQAAVPSSLAMNTERDGEQEGKPTTPHVSHSLFPSHLCTDSRACLSEETQALDPFLHSWMLVLQIFAFAQGHSTSLCSVQHHLF